MRRRHFLARLGASAALGYVPLGLAARARADVRCRDLPATPTSPPGRVCMSGLPSELIHVEARQERSQWCWAACVSMVFGYHGHPTSQERIVEEAYGSLLNMPAAPATLLAALNRDWVDDEGRRFRSISSPGTTNVVYAAQDLARNQPLILGTHGHAVVLTALEYAAPYLATPWGPQLGTPAITEAIVRDPWPGRGRRDLTLDEWNSIVFAAQIRVQEFD
ncbi:MAG: papain-like cysteine protease family protein [Polyangiales bacterium]